MKKSSWIILGIVVLMTIIILCFYIIKIFFTVYPTEKPSNFCDENTPCPSKSHTCVKLPEKDYPTCQNFMIYEIYECPEGTKKVTITTSPQKIVCLTEEDYVCPEKETINCMPIIIPGSLEEKYCGADYRNWTEENCNVQFLE